MDVRRACVEQKKAPSGAQLSPEITDKVLSCKSIGALFDVLAPLPWWSWIDLRLFSAMAAASGLAESLELLASYRQSVFSRNLIDVIPNAPNKKVKNDYYKKLVIKLDKDPNDVTVKDLLDSQPELEEVILDINSGVCILEHIQKGCIEIHFLVPAHCVENVCKSARQKMEKFGDFHLLSIQIEDYPTIHGPQSKEIVMIPAPIPSSMNVIVFLIIKTRIVHLKQYLHSNL